MFYWPSGRLRILDKTRHFERLIINQSTDYKPDYIWSVYCYSFIKDQRVLMRFDYVSMFLFTVFWLYYKGRFVYSTFPFLINISCFFFISFYNTCRKFANGLGWLHLDDPLRSLSRQHDSTSPSKHLTTRRGSCNVSNFECELLTRVSLSVTRLVYYSKADRLFQHVW